jgi:multiple sugar transport system substrate-binding protein
MMSLDKHGKLRMFLTLAFVAWFCAAGSNIGIRAEQRRQLVVWDWSDVYKNECRKAIDPVLTKFKAKNRNVELKIEPILNDDIRTKLLSAAAAGNLPDVAYLDGQWMNEFVENGLVLPLDSYVKKWGQSNDYSAAVWRSVTMKGKVYGIPGDGDVRTLLYRTDLFAKAGIKNPPKTWDELVKDARLLTRDTNGDGKIDQWGFALNGGNSEHTSMRSLPWIWDLGGDFVNTKGQPALDSPAVVKTLTFMNSLVNVHKVAPPNSYMNTKREVANLIKSGQAAMAIVGSWEWNGDASFLKTDSIKDKIASAPIPMATGSKAQHPYTAAGYGVWVIFKKPKINQVKKAAWDWINYCTTSQHMVDIFKYGTGNLGLRKSLFSNAEFQNNPVFKTFINVMPYARPRPVTPYYEVLSTQYRNAVQSVLSKNMTPGQALKQAQQKAKAEIKD